MHKAKHSTDKTVSARCLSTGHVHAAVAATAWVIGKETSAARSISTVWGAAGRLETASRQRSTMCWAQPREVRRSICRTKARRLTASARAAFTSRSSIVCKARSCAMKSTKTLKSLERLPKGPVAKARYELYKLSSWTKVDPGCRRSSSSACFLMSVQTFAARARTEIRRLAASCAQQGLAADEGG